MDDEINKLFKIGFKEVVTKIFPEIQLHKLSGWAAGSVGDQIDISLMPNFLRECWPQLSLTKNNICHFTSLKNTLNILKEKQIRLYNLEKFEDPMEFYYYFSTIKSRPKKQLENYRQGTFVFSGTDPDLINDKYSLHFWRSFGDNGLGCAMEFEVVLNDSSKYNYGNVIYELPPIKSIQLGLKKFLKDSNGKKFNPDSLFKMAACFYKNPTYASEQEIRLFTVGNLITAMSELNNTLPIIPFSDIHHGQIVYYTTLPLSKGKIKSDQPYLNLKKIHFGPRIQKKERLKLISLFSDIYMGNPLNRELEFGISKIPWK